MLNQKESKIIRISDLFGIENIKIPSYQRPYKWSEQSVNVLFNDILSAYKDKKAEYRLGTIIFFKDDNGYDIVDGQQRFTTLLLLLKILGYENKQNPKYSFLSIKSIKKNNEVLKNNVKSLENQNPKISQNDFLDYVLNNCTFVKFVIEERQEEAFQFFDSQNSRGKDLKPHDLLKAYHLREMKNNKLKIINKWENDYEENSLEEFFNDNLYPLVRWYKGKDGLYFDKSKIKTFKGIKKQDEYNYARYQKYFHKYIEKMRKFSFIKKDKYEFFQLSQELLAGEKFFEYTFYYYKLAEKIERLIEEHNIDENFCLKTLSNGAGDRYVRNLFKNTLIFFADRFSFESLNDNIYKKLFCWCYRLRIGMHAVYLETTNNYALGCHNLNDEVNIFEFINNMKYPEEINTLCIYPIGQKNKENKEITKLRETIEKECGWVNERH